MGSANRTLVPIHCEVAADLTDFEGSWTLFESGCCLQAYRFHLPGV